MDLVVIMLKAGYQDPANIRGTLPLHSHNVSDKHSDLFAFHELPGRMINGLFFKVSRNIGILNYFKKSTP